MDFTVQISVMSEVAMIYADQYPSGFKAKSSATKTMTAQRTPFVMKATARGSSTQTAVEVMNVQLAKHHTTSLDI